MMPPPKEPQTGSHTRISERSVISLGLAAKIIGAIIGFVVFIGSSYLFLEDRFDTIGSEITDIHSTVKDIKNEMGNVQREFNADRWRQSDMMYWAGEMQKKNPALDIPSIRDIR